MNAITLFTVLMFYGSESTDPNVSFVPQFAAFHYADDADGERMCKEAAREFNKTLVRMHYRLIDGRFECHVMSSGDLDRWKPGPRLTQPGLFGR